MQYGYIRDQIVLGSSAGPLSTGQILLFIGRNKRSDELGSEIPCWAIIKDPENDGNNKVGSHLQNCFWLHDKGRRVLNPIFLH